ncbi:MAG: enoyl-ACP reductase FabI [Magnetospirillum sp.]|nr:enoyl-ACP reductase FabI [Magnetospirillum sp.]
MTQTLDLTGKKGLVVGIANDQSIAYGCAKHCRAYGADLAVTYLNEKADRWLPCDVREPGQLEATFAAIEKNWGRLDFLIHSIAYADKDDLHGRVTDCSQDGFALAMDVSCHSFIRMAKLAEPLMTDGGCLMTVTFYGSRKVVEHYNVMGPVKAALETATKYMAHELGPKGIRVLALSPGPLKTRAASGIDRFDELMELAAAKAPTHQLATIDDCGAMAAFLVSDLARAVTGTTIFIDGGYHIVG